MDQETTNWDHFLEHAAISDQGLRRANNQDAMTVVVAGSQQKWDQRGHLFMVADGMGAHAAGELASKIATDTVALTYGKLIDKSPPEALRAAICDANQQIHSRGQASADFKGMGTTSTALLLLPQGAVAAHVGDSRAYRLRNHQFEQLTFDHSLVWEMRTAGQIPANEVPDYVPKNVITRSLGPNPSVEVDLEGPFPIEVGDAFLLCSDGLSGQVSDEEIGTLLACLPPDEAVQALVDMANLRGGPDNITIVVARVTSPLTPPGDASATPKTAAPPRRVRPVHPMLWAILVVALLAAVGLAGIGKFPAAAVAGAVALLTGIVALARRYGGGETGIGLTGQPLGKGPYTRCDVTPNSKSVANLREIVEELRDAATKEDWKLDWHHFNGLCQQADDAEKKGNFAEAVREYGRAMSFIMNELKHQRGPADTPSEDTDDGSSIFG